MKKYIIIILLSTPFWACGQITSNPKTLTHEEYVDVFGKRGFSLEKNIKIITNNEWSLERMTKEDQDENIMPRELRGLSWVFKPDKSVYLYITTEEKIIEEAKKNRDRFDITSTLITLHTTPKQIFTYELEITNGYHLTLKSEAGITFHLNSER